MKVNTNNGECTNVFITYYIINFINSHLLTYCCFPNDILIVGKVALIGDDTRDVNKKVETKDTFTQTLNNDDWALIHTSNTLAKPGCEFCHNPKCVTDPCSDLFEAEDRFEGNDDAMGKN